MKLEAWRKEAKRYALVLVFKEKDHCLPFDELCPTINFTYSPEERNHLYSYGVVLQGATFSIGTVLAQAMNAGIPITNYTRKLARPEDLLGSLNTQLASSNGFLQRLVALKEQQVCDGSEEVQDTLKKVCKRLGDRVGATDKRELGFQNADASTDFRSGYLGLTMFRYDPFAFRRQRDC